MPNLDRFQAGTTLQHEISVGACAGCGGDIFAGETIWIFDGAELHQDPECLIDYCQPETAQATRAVK